VPDLFIGIMSGTSLDGADAVLADLSQRLPRTRGSVSLPFPADLREDLLALSAPGNDGLDLAARCSATLARHYAKAVSRVLSGADVAPSEVVAIGCHGQTVRHRPEQGFTIQLNDAALLAELSGIDVIADFRRRDMAAGGQGAPLVPAFHEAVFGHEALHRVVVNIGGISNATSIRPGSRVTGFDCGPGNVLMDAWAKSCQGTEFDEDGKWAATGRVEQPLLLQLLEEPFLALPPPKSTGRELFNLDWLRARLDGGDASNDVQATLLEFTARAIVEAADRHCHGAHEIYLCGGGARNHRLATRIGELAAPRPVRLTDELGVPTGLVEPLAFAWLAQKFVRREALDLGPVTGARHPCILGALYPH
jgi:anhydro-N-acetylmuramic acid kinase